MVKEQGFKNVLFIGDDMILLNNLIYELLTEKKIPVIFAKTWDEAMKYIKNNGISLIILDFMLISKMKPSFIIPLIKKSRVPFIFINTRSDSWIHDFVKKPNNSRVIIYKQPLIVDRFLKTIQLILKNKYF